MILLKCGTEESNNEAIREYQATIEALEGIDAVWIGYPDMLQRLMASLDRLQNDAVDHPFTRRKATALLKTIQGFSDH